MDKLALLKANLGISSESRDSYLKSIISSVEDELEDKGIDVSTDVASMFTVDYSAWRFRNRGESIMPRNLRYRMNNLIVKGSGQNE